MVMIDKIGMWSIGLEGSKFPTDKANLYPYLLVILSLRLNYAGSVIVEITYKGINSSPKILSNITNKRACLYRTSDRVALMWTKDYFADIECFLNPLAFEWMVKP